MCFVFLRVDINFNLKDQLATPLYFPLRGQKEGRNDRKRQEQRKKNDDANGSVPLKLLVFLSLFVPFHSSLDKQLGQGETRTGTPELPRLSVRGALLPRTLRSQGTSDSAR